MNRIESRIALTAMTCLMAFGWGFSQPVFINEFLASNTTGLTDEAGQHDDWVELYNASGSPVDVGGMHLTDNLAQPAKWEIPATNHAATTIQPNGFLLIWLDGEPAQGVLHANFKLSAGGEELGLFAQDGSQVDALSFGPQTANMSYGRNTDGGTAFQFFTTPTPLASNGGTTGGSFAEAPAVSLAGGFYNGNIEVALTTPAQAQIRFTLDGSEPDANSTLYDTPLGLSQNTTLRARAFALGHLPSPVTTHTYIFDETHAMPVVALSFRPEDFFDPATGIYPNYGQDWGRPVQVEFFEEDGRLAFSQAATAEVHGTGSSQFSQKSLKIKALANNGDGYFQHTIFPDQPFDEYKNLLLRNAGQDWNVTMLRDGFVASLAADLSDLDGILAKPKLHLQAFRPGVAYLNGQYWGIHNLQEQMKADYVAQHFNLNENEFDLIENDAEVVAGDMERWEDFVNFLNNHSFFNEEHYKQLQIRLDLPHFMDYTAFNIIADNADWPGNNLRRWRERNGNDARWRFLSFDFDLSFGLLKIEGINLLFNTGDASANSLARALDASSNNWPNPWWTTLPLRKAMESPDFRHGFINRSADFLNVLFAPERVANRMDEFEAMYAPEIQRHFDRWSQGWNPWSDNLLIMRRFGAERPAFVRQHFVDFFDEITGTASVSLSAEPANGGGIHISTIDLPPSKLPWSGTYFKGVEIPISAAPAPGYVFQKWSDAMLGTDASKSLMLSEDISLTAIFEKGSTATDAIVINEINYHSPDGGDWVELFNPNDHDVDISGWVLVDEGGGYFNLPDNTVLEAGGYLVLAESMDEFSTFYPQVGNALGSFGEGGHGFKLNNGGELISLKNANLLLIDSVRYDDESPWSSDADGTGLSLQLSDWQLDNTLPESWMVQLPTPGQPNHVAANAQTIDFKSIGSHLTIALPIILQATATSGLPVSFAAMGGPATVTGNILTLTGLPGTVTVRASQQGGGDWQPAPPVTQSFEVHFPPGNDVGSFFPYILPNPIRSSLGVHFKNQEDGDVDLTVTAVNGVVLLRKKLEAVTAGPHFVSIDAAQWPIGFYFLTLRANGLRQVVVPFVKS
ncbi:MAG: CotH kinase family protein [Saprospiraceae bacterium]|nr:CotH kinase family protein [Saprospiraceae bacterium]